MAQPILRVAICDDDPLFAAALGTFVASDPELRVALTVHSGAQLLDDLAAGDVDVVLLDVRMPSMDGPTTALEISRRSAAKILYLTSYPGEVPIDDLNGVVLGALTKDIPPAELTRAIHMAAEGITVIAPAVRERISQPVADRIASLAAQPRDSDILRGLAEGLSNSEIAAQIHVSESTVKQAIAQLSRRAAVASRTGLMLHLHGVTSRSQRN